MRRLRPGLRAWPADPTQLASPVDGILGQLGPVREGRFLMPRTVAKFLGDALLLAAGDSESADVVFSIDEAKSKKP